MTDEEREKMRAWVKNWKHVGKVMEKLRLEESLNANLEQVILSLTDASKSAIAMHPPKPTSGLIEMQRIFMMQKR
jgi:hypothetical protein